MKILNWKNIIIAFLILSVFWFLFQIAMEEFYSYVCKINTFGHIIVAVAFSIICIFLFFQFKIMKKEEHIEKKIHKNSIRLGVVAGIIFLFLITIFDIYWGHREKGNLGAYYEPISWNEYIERLPYYVCVCSISGIFFYIFSHQQEKHNKKEKLKKQEPENNITELSQVNEAIK